MVSVTRMDWIMVADKMSPNCPTLISNKNNLLEISSEQCQTETKSSINEELPSDQNNFEWLEKAGIDEKNIFPTKPSLYRKNKPPNLQLKKEDEVTLSAGNKVIQQTSPSGTTNTPTFSGDETPTSQSATPLVTLTKQVVKVMDAGLSSTVIRRSLTLNEILQISDVQKAVVQDEGSQMRSLLNGEQSCANRQKTPAVIKSNNNQFIFEYEEDGNSSLSEKEFSPKSDLSTESLKDDSKQENENEIDLSIRPRVKVLQEKESITNPLELISNSFGPTNAIKNSAKAERRALFSLKRVKHKKSSSNRIQNTDSPKESPSKGKQSSLLSRLKFSSPKELEDNNDFEGWESLARALARVGVSTPSVTGVENFVINPPLSSILKRTRFVRKAELWNGDISMSLKIDPGSQSGLRKKNVSFSRLPSEAKIQSSFDCVSRMQEEQQFIKLRSNARVYNRAYWFDQEEKCLRWKPTKKDSGKAKIDISNIREVRQGKSSQLFLSSEVARHFPDDLSFSIIYGDGKSLDLIADTASEANIWITGLRCLISGSDSESIKTRVNVRDDWISSVFTEADINGDGFLDEDESFKLITNLSDGMRELNIKQLLKEYLRNTVDGEARLSREEFISLFKDVTTRPEIYFLLVRYSTNGDVMNMQDLHAFLESEQGFSNVTNEDCIELIKNFEPSEKLRSIPALGIDGFTKYLMSDRCCIFNPKHKEACQDMSQPLSHYFISSSHNTYLMEDQFGPCNISAYIRALLKCCRCVELDCWDGPDGQPAVTQGHTRNSSIPFHQVINAIKECAFHNSPYPVIICIENHCSTKQQIKMANILRDILGKKIYTDHLNGSNLLPSPESLKYQFLIRARKLDAVVKDDVGFVTEDDEGAEILAEFVSPFSGEEKSRVVTQAKQKQPLVRELSDLVSINVTTMAQDFATHQHLYSFRHSCSIHEEFAYEFANTNPEEFVSHTKKFLTRVFPSGYRRDSSNFNPQDYWNCGVQMVSLNYQTPGLMMDINDGRFSMNGGCGYVLKPEVMRNELEYYDADARDGLPGVAPKILHLRIISGQNFPKPKGGGAKGQVIDPYVLIELFGFPPDCCDQRTRTAVNNNGDSPIFDELFEFRLFLPSLALIRFVVLDDDFIGDEFIGQYTIPFDCLQSGYRHLRLRSLFDEPLENSSLFVHIAVSESDIRSSIPGNLTPNAITVSRKDSNKRASQKKLRKQRSKKDLFAPLLYDVNKPEIDAVFESAREHLQLASSLCTTFKSSLLSFKETCGVPTFTSIKQCIRILAKRISREKSFPDPLSVNINKRGASPDFNLADNNESQHKNSTSNTDSGTMRRHTSDTSQSSNETSSSNPVRIHFERDQQRISMKIQSSSSISDEWKRLNVAFDNLIDDCVKMSNQAMNCCNILTSLYEKAGQLHEDLFEFLSQNESPLTSQDSGVFVNGTIGRKQGKSKKQAMTAIVDSTRRRKISALDSFLWNCSTLKGRRDELRSCHQHAEDILANAWVACVQCGLTNETETLGSIGSTSSKSGNQNLNNNNVAIASQKILGLNERAKFSFASS